jgi:plasmid stabilization system protein ParE
MAVEVNFHEAASAEFEAAFDWYYLRSEFVASKFVEEVSHAIAMISDGPKRWRKSTRDTRRFVLERFPFAIYFRELPSGVQVLAVAHGHRKPGYWKNRL